MMKTRQILAGLTLAAATLSGAVIAHAGPDGFGHKGCDKGERGHGAHHRGNKAMTEEQRTRYQEKRLEKRISRMQRHLDLSDEQVSQITALFESSSSGAAHRGKPQGRHGLMHLDPQASDYDQQVAVAIEQRQALMAERMQAQAERQQQLHQILTAEQWQQMQQWQEKRYGH